MKLTSLLHALRFLWTHSRWWFIFTIGLTLLLGLIPLATLWVTKELINEIALLIQNDVSDYTTAFYLLALQFFTTIVSSILRHVQSYLDKHVEFKLDHDLQKMIAHKTTSAPLAYFDDPTFFNHLNRIQGGLGSRFLAPVRSTFQIMESVIRGTSLLAFLLTIHWILVVLSVSAAIPLFVIQKRFGDQRFWLQYHQTPTAREAQYTSHLLTDRQSAKEIRVFGLASHLLERWSEKFTSNVNGFLQLYRRQQAITIGTDSITAIFYAMAAGTIIWLTKTSKMQVGDFVAIGQAMQNTQGAVNQISGLIARINEESLYIHDFFEFLNFERPELVPTKQSASSNFPLLQTRGIEFSEVSYRYPGNQREILKNICFQIKPGERIAIVGENGSGKTTLTKCLTGLYPVGSGQILFEGIPISSIKEEDLYRNVSVIFQDFMKYAYSIRDNIAFGDLDRKDDILHLQEISKQTGVDAFVTKFAEQYETYLGRFLRDGEELSGGQWQKIALSRALYKDSQVIILDEPTAALDPQAELEVFQQFDRLTAGKTTFFISHRMASARIADRIFVMKQGELVEVGSHDELMQLDGEYARMYRMQAQWYQDELPNVSEVV